MPRDRVAVVGAGVSGLTAAYVLQRECDVTLFEAEDRLGGHAHTHAVPTATGGTVNVDSGFIVHNEATYPHLIRLFGELGVATQDSEMSMSVRDTATGLEYAGARGAAGLFAQRRNLANPRHLAMLAEVLRFHRAARRVLAEGDLDDEVTLGEFLRRHRFSRHFVDTFAVPVVSAVWSSGAALSMQYPARYLFAFLANHGLLSVGGSHQWRTVVGGSARYVERVVKGLSAVEVSTPVRAVVRDAEGIEVRDDADVAHRFDRVVVATHAPTALSQLAAPTVAERELLGAFTYSANETWLHTDTSVLPRAADARASWNLLRVPDDDRVLVSYDMTRLMRLPGDETYVVTLNATDRVDPARVIARMDYEHPAYTPASVAAQRRLPELNDGRVAFAGAYHGWGFHEDGCASGVRAAASLGVTW
ncbi:FAD-dependent oxidoreductase [Actinomycetospora sp. TBRC 11914]|uniref:NAD(P)/FAD-dependent oxidoreductase n=1 Tax=Actinomycetospora sp. TBRC 11914 TaxID=2729387 RepID=UPI00145D8CB3|nr:FAD-dependent oxidoreductase [Actinomycetospora sp. TBRC 11914]NMO89822.1 NAD(P)-binding protein [Actinomycetospora sp. TBRC 11914]